MKIYSLQPNPFVNIVRWWRELSNRYRKSPWYTKPLWWIAFLIILTIVSIGILTIPNVR